MPKQSKSEAHFPLMWGLRNDKRGNDDVVTWLPIIGHLTPLSWCWSVVVVELYTERCTGPAGIWGRDGGWTGTHRPLQNWPAHLSSHHHTPAIQTSNWYLQLWMVKNKFIELKAFQIQFFLSIFVINCWITCSKFLTQGGYWNYPWIPQIQNNPLLNEWN